MIEIGVGVTVRSHVYWVVRCKACGCNEWIFLCHVGVFDRHKKYTFKDKIRFDVVCPACGGGCPYTEKDVRCELGEEPEDGSPGFPTCPCVGRGHLMRAMVPIRLWLLPKVLQAADFPYPRHHPYRLRPTCSFSSSPITRRRTRLGAQ
jgi:hypothetical protein